MPRPPKGSPTRVPVTMPPQADDDRLDPIDLFDVATETLHEAQALTELLMGRLDAQWEVPGCEPEMYALSLLARHVTELHDRLKGQIEALHPALVVALRALKASA